MVEREYIVSRWANGKNYQQLPILIVKEKDVNSKPNRWKWGFRDKTGWDFLDLLLGPVLITLLLFFLSVRFNERAKDREEYFNSEQNKQEILRSYLATMTGLISEGKLSNQNKTPQTNQAAKALTQSALQSFDKAVLSSKLRNVDERTQKQSELDAKRKGQVLQFLYDAQLITNESPKFDTVGFDLNGANLERKRLGSPDGKSVINLSGASLYNANLKNAQLEKAHMEGTHLPYAHLEGAVLKGAKLGRANLRNASLNGANLQGADLDHADLTLADLTDADLSNPGGNENFQDIKLNRAILKGAKLTGTKLGDADLNGADLTDADLTDAKMIKTADMQGAIFCRTTMPDGTVWSDNCSGQPQP